MCARTLGHQLVAPTVVEGALGLIVDVFPSVVAAEEVEVLVQESAKVRHVSLPICYDMNTINFSIILLLSYSCAVLGNGVLNCSKFPASDCGSRSGRRCTTDDSGVCVPNPRFVGAIDEFGK